MFLYANQLERTQYISKRRNEYNYSYSYIHSTYRDISYNGAYYQQYFIGIGIYI